MRASRALADKTAHASRRTSSPMSPMQIVLLETLSGGLDFRMPHGELPFVVAVAVSAAHGFIKQLKPSIRLIARLGAAGDAHRGASVQHLYDKRKDPLRPNLRQIHLIEAELMDALNELGFPITPGALGENIVTRNLALLRLSEGTELQLGRKARLTITGLRTPCAKIDGIDPEQDQRWLG